MSNAEETLIVKLSLGYYVAIDLWPDIAPITVDRIITLARNGEYDNVAFHRVIDGFVAQTGDVQYGDVEDGFDLLRTGQGNSDLPDIVLEPSDTAFDRGIMGMARNGSDFDSNNSQFFFTTDETNLNTTEASRYTAFGEVIDGMQFIDMIPAGLGDNGAVFGPPVTMERVFLADDLKPGRTEIGTASNDTMTGGRKGEAFFGLDGNDSIVGNNGRDLIIAGDGKDTLKGGNGADELEGGRGNDKLFGNSGSDTLSGGEGRDNLQGKSGDDVLDGGDGNDILNGAKGADTSAFTGRDFGSDTIKGGFTVGEDMIDLRETGYLLRDVDISQSGGNTQITLGDDRASILVEGVTGLAGNEDSFLLI